MSCDLSLYDFELPADRIAQRAEERGKSRLFVIKEDGSFAHGTFPDVAGYFGHGDLLVINDTKVLKARLIGKTTAGGRVEMLFAGTVDEKRFRALVRPGKKFKAGARFSVGDAVIRTIAKDGREAELVIERGPGIMALMESHGQIPLPPYIKRPPEPEDETRYQTVFSEKPGSVAAPTAGLHFTPEILEKIRETGAEVLTVTLHVGPGTFNPIRVPDLKEHKMESEWYEVPDETADAIKRTKEMGKRVFVCGTTCTRALESWAMGQGPRSGWTSLFIYPGHDFRVPDALITNFHLPRSTPLALVAAFCGRETILRAYAEALERGYAFGSYGDAMLVLRPVSASS